MSWDSYIDNIMAQSKDGAGSCHIDKATIIGLDGGASWTTPGHPSHMPLSQQEGASIAKSMKCRDFTPFQCNGVYVGGEKYQFLRQDEDKIVYGKKKGLGSVTLQASKTAVVIAHCPEGCQQGNCNKAVANVAEYLESMNM